MVYFPALKALGGMVFAQIPYKDMEKDDGLLPEDPIMLKTPILDANQAQLYEGDICECGVLTSYGAVKERGVIVWRPDLNSFSVNIAHAYDNMSEFNIINARKIGNIYENPEIINERDAYKNPNAKSS